MTTTAARDLSPQALRRLCALADIPTTRPMRSSAENAWLDLVERVRRMYGLRATTDDLHIMCLPALPMLQAGESGWLVTGTEPGRQGYSVNHVVFANLAAAADIDGVAVFRFEAP